MLLETRSQTLAVGNWAFTVQRMRDRLAEHGSQGVGTGMHAREFIAFGRTQWLCHRSNLRFQLGNALLGGIGTSAVTSTTLGITR